MSSTNEPKHIKQVAAVAVICNMLQSAQSTLKGPQCDDLEDAIAVNRAMRKSQGTRSTVRKFLINNPGITLEEIKVNSDGIR